MIVEICEIAQFTRAMPGSSLVLHIGIFVGKQKLLIILFTTAPTDLHDLVLPEILTAIEEFTGECEPCLEETGSLPSLACPIVQTIKPVKG